MSMKDRIQTGVYMVLFLVGGIFFNIYFIQSIYWHVVSKHIVGEYTGSTYTRRTTGLFGSNFVNYKYTVNDVGYTGISSTSLDPNASGDPIVFYNPSDPSISSLDDSISWITLIFGVSFLLVFVLILKELFKHESVQWY
jgi:hypothetical protein